MGFTPRFTIPEKGNKFYNTKASGGYSNAIKGKPTQAGLDVLSNCVGYAYGRFHEIAGDKTMSMLCPVNAENFIDYASKSLKVGTEPKLGAVIVWQRGATKNGSDGAGHVGIVEQINADGSIITSESGWNSSRVFWTTKRTNANGRWGESSNYKFLGFIYQPKEIKLDPVTPKEETFKPYTVKVKIPDLNIRKGPGTNYGTTGKYTGVGVFTIVAESKGQGSTKGWGKLKSGAGWISLDYASKN